MKTLKFYVLFLTALAFISCATAKNSNIATITRSTGTVLGTASATAFVGENRKTGETSGDTKKYGYIVSENEKSSQVERLAANSLTKATDIAYANALYEVIQQAREAGGNALNEVISTVNREFDFKINAEIVTVTITATIVKTDKK